MSNDAIQWILNDRTLTGPDKALMFALAARANWSKHSGDDVAFPGWELLQRDAGLARTAVANALKRLEARGYVYVTRSAGRGNSYYLPTPAGHWCAERLAAYGDERAPMGAPGSPAALADAAAGRPVREAYRSARRTGPRGVPVKALLRNETAKEDGATRPRGVPVREADPYPSASRTTPVREAALPVREAYPNHKNLNLSGNSESGGPGRGELPPPVEKPAARPVAGYAATTAGAKLKGKGKGKPVLVVDQVAVTTDDLEACNAWLVQKGIRRAAVH